MKRIMILLAILFLLLPLPAHAGPAAVKLLGVMGESCPPSPTPGAFTINGYATISQTGPGTVDTGTARICTNAGNLSIPVSCSRDSVGTTTVTLYINGALYNQLACNNGSSSATYTPAVEGGAVLIRVVGFSDATTSSFGAGPFTKP